MGEVTIVLQNFKILSEKLGKFEIQTISSSKQLYLLLKKSSRQQNK